MEETAERGRVLGIVGGTGPESTVDYYRSLVATWRGAARPSRYSPRCGTNFAALLIPVAMLLDRFWLLPTTAFTPVLVTVAAVTLTMEIWLAAQRTRFARVVVLPGLALQRLTTREPTLVETRVALRAVAAVLDHHAAS